MRLQAVLGRAESVQLDLGAFVLAKPLFFIRKSYVLASGLSRERPGMPNPFKIIVVLKENHTFWRPGRPGSGPGVAGAIAVRREHFFCQNLIFG